MTHSLESLTLPAEPTSPDEQCATIYERFSENPDTLIYPVVQGDRPVGLINRHEFIHAMAHKYGRALYDKRPVDSLMERTPLVVDVDTPLETLNRLIVDENPAALLKGFIVTREGRYLGIGTALSLLQFTNQHIHQRARELDQARKAAEQASIAKSTFLATMSHELRTPLNAVMGFSELIEQEAYGPAGDSHYVEYAGLIRSSGEHLLTIIDDVLDMSRVEAGKLELFEDQFSPAAVAARCAAILESQSRDKGVSLSVEHADTLPDLVADEKQFRQIILNLLSNAVKFTPRSGAINLRMSASEDEFLLAVVDTGIGIAQEDLAQVLKPFVQADSGHQRVHHGTGLGLPLTKSLVELHGGNLEISSTLGVGTTVTVRLPAPRIVRAAPPLLRVV